MIKRTVKSKEELLELFNKNYEYSCGGWWSKGIHSMPTDIVKHFNDKMFYYCGKDIGLSEPNKIGRMRLSSDTVEYYFIEEWLKPIKKEHDEYSREWWKERLPLINAFVEEKDIMFGQFPLNRPKFNDDIDQYEIKPIMLKLKSLDKIKSEFMHTILVDDSTISFHVDLRMLCIMSDMIPLFGTEFIKSAISTDGVDNYVITINGKRYSFDERWFE